MPRRRRLWWFGAALLVPLALWGAHVVRDELRTSRRQAAWLAEQARQQSFEVRPGPSAEIRFPGDGPFDRRLGYTALPAMLERLDGQGYAIGAQARMSPGMLAWVDDGFFPAYREKTQAGLTIRDCRGEALYRARFPEAVYARFDAVPPAVVGALLFVENHELLDEPATRNPAVQWDRFGKALLDQLLRRVDPSHAAGGGSTLATQIEKFRHSPGGRTAGVVDKFRQMASGSMRAYLDGEDTMARRREIVLDYLNTVPLSAQSGIGEVHGLGDALRAWYGRDFDEVNRLLSAPDDDGDAVVALRVGNAAPAPAPRKALAFKQVLSLIVAQRRPSYYLSPGRTPALRAATDTYLRLLAQAGIVSPALRDAALPLSLELREHAELPPTAPFVERKAATALRTHLQKLLAVPRACDLDRLDLSVDSHLSAELQATTTDVLHGLTRTEVARAAGLYGRHLLSEGDDTSRISLSFTLFESRDGVNLLRVQTDNVDQPFDLNEGARLDLGSTSKLRTLVTYLEQVAALHERWSALDARELAALKIGQRDAIARWAREHLARAGDRSLQAMLEAAMQRTYSADPGEAFFTGGGLHRFENFDDADNARRMTVSEALTRSVNLVFIRMMRDVVYRVMADGAGTSVGLLEDPSDPRRQEYLARFADREGRQFVARFHRKYASRTPQEIAEQLLQGVRRSPVALASAFYGLEPDADAARLAAFLDERLSAGKWSAQTLHDKYRTGRWSLSDRGYLAGIHPLELWVAGHLRQNPGATLRDTLAASEAQRQEVYGWLFNTRRKGAQDQRIRGLLELDAFREIHRAWQRLGYPFEALTPSYATSLGASGDRPAALAELMGILVNDGVRLPTVRVDRLRFADGTPYETALAHRPATAERVLAPEVARVARKAVLDVVENGTARRLKGALTRRDGTAVPIGGKTGTGDHRFDTYGRGGQVIASRVVNRSATMAFMIGDRWFGTIMAYVHEPYAARFRFTSALPAQLLKTLAPHLLPLVEGTTCDATAVAALR